MRWDDNRKPLADWITEGFEILLAHIDDPREGIPQERAYQVLLESSKFPDEPADAEYAIKRLLDRGYFYKVDDNLRVTEPGDHQ